jgi:metal-responsive CopG/Arc/MetJ family transcriptional regulator
MNKTEIVNVRISKDLLKKLDPLLQEKSFSSRSEAIRQFLREHVQEEKSKTSNNGGLK